MLLFARISGRRINSRFRQPQDLLRPLARLDTATVTSVPQSHRQIAARHPAGLDGDTPILASRPVTVSLPNRWPTWTKTRGFLPVTEPLMTVKIPLAN